MDEVGTSDALGHGQVDRKDLEDRGMDPATKGRPGFVCGLHERRAPGTAEAVHTDVDQAGKLGGKVLHMHAGTAVDLGRELPR